MNKKALIEFVRVSILKSEANADNQKTLHFQRVAQGVNYAFNTLLSQIKLDDSGKAKISQYFVKDYYAQPVKESGGYRYFGISDEIVPIGEGRGVWYVQPTGGGTPFPYSQRPSTNLFANMAVGEAMNQTVWRFGNITDNRQIIIENIGDSPLSDVRSVDYGVVRSFSSYDSDEEVIIPDGRSDLLVAMCREWLSGVYVDMANNNQ